MDEFKHRSVLLDETISSVLTVHNGTYVDATFGRGGHARALHQASGASAKIIGLDRDLEAIKAGQALIDAGIVSVLIHSPFSAIADVLKARDVQYVDGVIMDIGVSSPQLDDAQRGFSFRNDGPLDMRMDQSQGFSAQEWVNTTDVSTMARTFRQLGEEPQALAVAKKINRAREQEPIVSTAQLASIVAGAMRGKSSPRNERIHPATRVFQAIRMVVNDELGELERGLESAWQVLAQHGRLAVIAFHSLEDRMVKRFMRELTHPDRGDRPWAAQELAPSAKAIAFPLKPSAAEIAHNPRARSARLRVVEKI